MKPRAITKIILTLLATIILVASVLTLVVPRWRVNAYVKQLQKEGERLALSDWLPDHPPSNQSSAHVFTDALSLFPRTRDVLQTNPPRAMREQGSKVTLRSRQPDIRSKNGVNTWEEVEDSLAKVHDELGQLEKLIGQEPHDLHLSYDVPFRGHPDNWRVWEAADALEAAALVSLHRQDYAKSVNYIRTLFAISEAMRYEPAASIQRSRLRIANRAFATTWELLQYTNLTDAQLSAIATDLSTLDFMQIAEKTCCMERAQCKESIGLLRSSPSPEQYIWGSSVEIGWKDKSLLTLWRFWLGYLDELHALQGYEILIKSARTLTTNRVFHPVMSDQFRQFSKSDKRIMLPGDGPRFDANLIDPFLEQVSETYSYLTQLENTETMRQLAVAAVALRRYQTRYGTYPKNLEALVPEFLTKVPLDPEDGKILRYKPGEKIFLLYSVGANGVNDGGRGRVQEIEPFHSPRDLVWPQLENDSHR